MIQERVCSYIRCTFSTLLRKKDSGRAVQSLGRLPVRPVWYVIVELQLKKPTVYISGEIFYLYFKGRYIIILGFNRGV